MHDPCIPEGITAKQPQKVSLPDGRHVSLNTFPDAVCVVPSCLEVLYVGPWLPASDCKNNQGMAYIGHHETWEREMDAD